MNNIKSAVVEQVIVIKTVRGSGIEKDPVRIVTQYWDFEGHLLAENDPLVQQVTS